jgi:hypothetical protein
VTRHLAGREERNLYFILQGSFRLISQRNKTSHHTHCIGRALPQAVSHRLLVTWARSHPHVVPCVIYGGQAGTGTGFSGVLSIFLCQYHSIIASHSTMCLGGWKGPFETAIPHRYCFSPWQQHYTQV